MQSVPIQHVLQKLQSLSPQRIAEKECSVVIEFIDGRLLKHDAKRWMQARG